jgi:predicted O-methyltransferase YrrM
MTPTWWGELVAMWMPADGPPAESKRLGLAAKRDAVAHLRPRSICEIGVRAGYSAFAMLSAAPAARFVGIDSADPTYRNAVAAYRWAGAVVLARFANVTLVLGDSRDVEAIDPPVDLVHIDGDHSEAGCRADLELALRSGARWALVDDTIYIPAVRRAVEAFAAEHGTAVEWVDDGHHGTAILLLGGKGGP